MRLAWSRQPANRRREEVRIQRKQLQEKNSLSGKREEMDRSTH
jgi:hypothetical protein